MYAIESGVPIPRSKKGGGRPEGPKTPLTQTLWALDRGQSFVVDSFDEYKRASSYFARLPTKRFAVRKLGQEGWRIWRME